MVDFSYLRGAHAEWGQCLSFLTLSVCGCMSLNHTLIVSQHAPPPSLSTATPLDQYSNLHKRIVVSTTATSDDQEGLKTERLQQTRRKRAVEQNSQCCPCGICLSFSHGGEWFDHTYRNKTTTWRKAVSVSSLQRSNGGWVVHVSMTLDFARN
jgi:hypothetical protein